MPERGDRVRVVLEGEVSGIDGRWFDLGKGADGNCINATAAHVVSVEILPRPMPPLPTEPTPIMATVRGVEDVLLLGPDEVDGEWCSAKQVRGERWHLPEHISAWRVWTPGGER